MRSGGWRWVPNLAAACAIVAHAHAAEPSREYELKAAFLYNFAKFVEWPHMASQPSRPITIGIYRNNPFAGALIQAVAGRKILGHPLVVKQVHQLSAAREVQVLFVSSALDSSAAEIIEALKDSPVLTVGESPTFASKGGIITFQLKDDSLRFSINAPAARKSGIKISSQLQKLAAKPTAAGAP